jgi:hypothetical protein
MLARWADRAHQRGLGLGQAVVLGQVLAVGDRRQAGRAQAIADQAGAGRAVREEAAVAHLLAVATGQPRQVGVEDERAEPGAGAIVGQALERPLLAGRGVERLGVGRRHGQQVRAWWRADPGRQLQQLAGALGAVAVDADGDAAGPGAGRDPQLEPVAGADQLDVGQAAVGVERLRAQLGPAGAEIDAGSPHATTRDRGGRLDDAVVTPGHQHGDRARVLGVVVDRLAQAEAHLAMAGRRGRQRSAQGVGDRRVVVGLGPGQVHGRGWLGRARAVQDRLERGLRRHLRQPRRQQRDLVRGPGELWIEPSLGGRRRPRAPRAATRPAGRPRRGRRSSAPAPARRPRPVRRRARPAPRAHAGRPRQGGAAAHRPVRPRPPRRGWASGGGVGAGRPGASTSGRRAAPRRPPPAPAAPASRPYGSAVLASGRGWRASVAQFGPVDRPAGVDRARPGSRPIHGDRPGSRPDPAGSRRIQGGPGRRRHSPVGKRRAFWAPWFP